MNLIETSADQFVVPASDSFSAKLGDCLSLSYNGYSRPECKMYENNSISVLMNRTFTFGPDLHNVFFDCLSHLYQNQYAKVVLDALAVHALAYDDLIIQYGFCSSALGYYASPYVYGIQSHDIEYGFHNINIGFFVDQLSDTTELEGTIIHEMTHMLAQLLFDNGSSPYFDEPSFIYTQAASKLLHDILAITAKDVPELFDSVDKYVISELIVDTVLSTENEYTDVCVVDVNNDTEALVNLVKIFFMQGYDADDIDAEIFARISEAVYSGKDFPNILKFLQCFSVFLEQEVNPEISEMFSLHASSAIQLNIDSCELNLASIQDQSFALIDELFFAIADGNEDKVGCIIEAGVNLDELAFSIFDVKALAMHSDNMHIQELVLGISYDDALLV